MILQNFHCHTTYCDGENSPEEMVLSAIEKGITDLGFSGHSFVPFDPGYCMGAEKEAAYRAETAALKKKYSYRITIYCGIEQDIQSPLPKEPFDYMIGSVHYVETDMGPVAVDYMPERMEEAVERCYSGDWLSLCESYFESVSDVVNRTGCDIIGHFDLITKYNEGCRLFDCTDTRYVRAWQKAADRLLAYGIPFEINTGAMSRGYRTAPYPSIDIIRYIHSNGGKFILSSDAHRRDDLLYGFDETLKMLEREGVPVYSFKELKGFC